MTAPWAGGSGSIWLPQRGDTITFEGDAYSGSIQQPIPGRRLDVRTYWGRWTHPIGQDSDFSAQVYWDRTYRAFSGSFSEELNTYDVDFSIAPDWRASKAYLGRGLSPHARPYRQYESLRICLRPPDRKSATVQRFFAGRNFFWCPTGCVFTLGTKLEHNDYSEFEFQPSGRLTWCRTIVRRSGRHFPAVRSPSRIDRDLYARFLADVAAGIGRRIKF